MLEYLAGLSVLFSNIEPANVDCRSNHLPNNYPMTQSGRLSEGGSMGQAERQRGVKIIRGGGE